MTSSLTLSAIANQPISDRIREKLRKHFYVGARQITASPVSVELLEELAQTLSEDSVQLRRFSVSLATYEPRSWLKTPEKCPMFILVPNGKSFTECVNQQGEFQQWFGPICSGVVSNDHHLKVKSVPQQDLCETVGGEYLFSKRLAALLRNFSDCEEQNVLFNQLPTSHVRLIHKSIDRILSERCILKTVPCTTCRLPFNCEFGIWMTDIKGVNQAFVAKDSTIVGHSEHPYVVSTDVAHEILSRSYSCMIAPVFSQDSIESELVSNVSVALMQFLIF